MTTWEAKEIVVGHRKDCSKADIDRAWLVLLETGTIWQMGDYWARLGSALFAAGEIDNEAAYSQGY